MHAAKRYLSILAMASLVLAAGVALFNALVDPFGVFRIVESPGFNVDKPEFVNNTRMAKAHAVRAIAPRLIALGTSRADIGIDVRHGDWGGVEGARYNLGLAGASLNEIRRYFDHAIAAGDVRVAVFVTDFLAFNKTRGDRFGFDQSRLLGGDGTRSFWLSGFSGLSDHGPLLFSLDALAASLETLRRQGLVDKGLRPDISVGQLDVTSETMLERKDFINGDVVAYLPPPLHGYSFVDRDSGRSSWEDFDAMLSAAIRNDVDLRIIVPPLHAILLEAFDLAGLWPDYEAWRRGMARAASDRCARARGARCPVRIWDFSGFHDFAREPIPGVGQPRPMEWFIDNNHFSRRLGNLMLDVVFDTTNRRDPPEGFGVLLTPDTVEEVLTRLRRGRDQYARSHPEEMKEMKDVLRELSRSRPCGRVRCDVATAGLRNGGAEPDARRGIVLP